MNYSKKGVSEKQQALNAKSSKWGRKAALIFFKVFLVVFLSVGIVGAFGVLGVAKGIIDEVVATVKDWRKLANRLGIAKREMNLFEGVFDSRMAL